MSRQSTCLMPAGSRLLPSLVLLLAIPSITMPVRASAIPWRTHYESAEAEARASGKPLWVQFTGSWCGYCRRMDSETFSRQEVAAFAYSEFIPVKVDTDVRPDLMVRYGISGLPATVFVAPNGQVIRRHDGFADVSRFLGILAASRLAPPPAPVEPAPAPVAVALEGHDPVSLVEGEGLLRGDPALTVLHDGLEYRFANADDRRTFLDNPERFIPVLQGYCPVSLLESRASVPGDTRYGVYYKDRLYFCASEAMRNRFASEPERYAEIDLAENGLCPHCREVEGRKIPGTPACSTVYQGRRYLFPDDAHRSAFREAPDRYVR